MTIWWCEVHNACWVPATDEPADPEDACLYWYWMTDTNRTAEAECRMVEMQLAPKNAIVISEEERRVWEFANRGPS